MPHFTYLSKNGERFHIEATNRKAADEKMEVIIEKNKWGSDCMHGLVEVW